MTYRSAEAALTERLAQVEDDLVAARAREKELAVDHAALSAEIADLDRRLKVSGPGGAARGPFFDRINVIVWSLCVVGVLVMPAEIYIGGYVRRQPEETIVPILLLAGPGLMAAIVAWPYHHIAHYRRGAIAGALLAAFALTNIVVGAFR